MKFIDFFPRFNELTPEDLQSDFHLHSTWTDGKQSVEQIVKRAVELNIDSIAITDHIRKSSTYFIDAYNEVKEIDACNLECTLYSGFEAKVDNFSGDIDVDSELLEKADVAIASVHRFPLGNRLYNAGEFSQQIAQEIELELSLAALKKRGFNVLGHPGGMSMTFFKAFPEKFYEEIIVQCKKHEIAFDLNGRYHANVLDMLLPLLATHNPHISIGSDAHDVKFMGSWNVLLRGKLF